MRIVMIGGTGFLGYFTSMELLRRGHAVVAVGLRMPNPGQMPDGAETAVLNTDTCSEAELAALIENSDCVIHAAGAMAATPFRFPPSKASAPPMSNRCAASSRR